MPMRNSGRTSGRYNVKLGEMDEERLKEELGHWFMPPLAIAKGFLELAIEDEEDGEQERRLEEALRAIMRAERVAGNMIYTGEIHE